MEERRKEIEGGGLRKEKGKEERRIGIEIYYRKGKRKIRKN